MRIFETSHVYDYDWEHVSKANWKKYPNELTPHVEAVDVLSRHVDPATGVLRTERLLTLRQGAPSWVQMLLGKESTTSYVREVSVVDAKNKSLVMRSQNLTLNNVLSVFETVSYHPDPQNPSSTVFNQQAQFTAYLSWQKLCRKVEEFCVDRFVQNASLGKEAFESVLQGFHDLV